ncbi:MAG: hypothetical protein WBQ31_18870, partial [Candidatus Acidiferrales bacterium]
ILLASVLSGNQVVGPWTIAIATLDSGGPCSTNSTNGCVIVSPSATAVVAGYPCTAVLAAASPQPACYSTLSESVTAGGTSFTLAGDAYVDTTTVINQVKTYQNVCGAAGATVSAATTAPSTCVATQINNGTYEFTEAAVPGGGVSVTAGQSVAVTVVFSFH